MIRPIALAGLVTAAGLCAPGTVRADEKGEQLAAVLKAHANKVVTLEVVANVSFGGRAGRERRMNVPGTVIDASGLIMTSDGPFGGNDFVKVSVQSMKVIVDRDEEAELEAFVVATDSKLHVAFVQVENLGDRKLEAVDLSADATPKIGDPIVQVARKSKGFDFAPYFSTARIAGKIKKPRMVWEFDGNASAGLCAFDLDGKVLGFVTQVESGLGRGSENFLLPARPIRASVQQATKKAAEMLVQRAKEKAEGGAKKDGAGEKKDDDAGKDDGGAKKDDDSKQDDGAGKSDGGK